MGDSDELLELREQVADQAEALEMDHLNASLNTSGDTAEWVTAMARDLSEMFKGLDQDEALGIIGTAVALGCLLDRTERARAFSGDEAIVNLGDIQA